MSDSLRVDFGIKNFLARSSSSDMQWPKQPTKQMFKISAFGHLHGAMQGLFENVNNGG